MNFRFFCNDSKVISVILKQAVHISNMHHKRQIYSYLTESLFPIIPKLNVKINVSCSSEESPHAAYESKLKTKDELKKFENLSILIPVIVDQVLSFSIR